jgi:hypothetical protein
VYDPGAQVNRTRSVFKVSKSRIYIEIRTKFRVQDKVEKVTSASLSRWLFRIRQQRTAPLTFSLTVVRATAKMPIHFKKSNNNIYLLNPK